MAAVTIPKLLATKNPISFSLTISIISLFLVNKVTSDFSFPHFPPDVMDLGLANDATLSNGAIQLTKKDESGNPLQHSVGQSRWMDPIRIYDKRSGKVADFVTEFTFVVNPNGRVDHGDGFAFFLISPDFNFPDSTKSEGGFLGMFTPETAFNSSAQQVLLVEFDSFVNEWDPNAVTQSRSPHVGIDVSSIKSVATGFWLADFELDGTVGKARIVYNSLAKQLTVSVTYPTNKGQMNEGSSLTHEIDLMTILPEKVQIGFSAATGDLAETRDILSWSFTSNL